MKAGEIEVYSLEKAKALPIRDFSSVLGENFPHIHMEGELDYK